MATKLNLAMSPVIRDCWMVARQAQKRYSKKLTRAPAMNAVMLAT
jgi:hypothetical protein